MQKQRTHNEYTSNPNQHTIIIVCDHLTGPANIGSLFRLSDAFGVKELLFIGNAPDITSNRLKRTARNTQNTIHFKSNVPIAAITNLRDKEGYTLVGIEITNKSIPLTEFKVPNSKKIVIIIGNEQRGISKDLLDLCSLTYHINMYGNNSSMNVSHAAAIALYGITTKINSTK